ncbi:hypothetical protein DFR33_102406 [Bradymonas sediminis]|nr:hypothetical protein DFR33_102406 [Bradymonas sediminis]
MSLFDKRMPNNSSDTAEPPRRDSAVTAEFDYIDDWGDDFGDDSTDKPSAELRLEPNVGGADEDPVTRAVEGADAFGDGFSPSTSVPSNLSVTGSSPGASQAGWGFGYDQPQVSGVFSRYEEETEASDSGAFDLFEDAPSAPAHVESPLKAVVSTHDKKIRRLHKQVAYQKEIIQVISELLVESTVISRDELKKRLQALRKKSR